jgi:hypothetical protein
MRVLLAAVLTACLATAAPAAAADLPPQGLYDQCSPAQSGDACASRLGQMGQAGFKLVLNYTSWDATPQQLTAFADAAAASGMQVIWPLNNAVWRTNGDITGVYPKLAAASGATHADELLAYVAGLLKGHPATWGWYIGDELPATELPAVIGLNLRIKALDPGHPTLYVAYEHSGIGGANLAPFGTAADTVGSAIYPVGTGADPLEQMRVVTDLVKRLVPARARAMVLQAFDWAQHPNEVSLPGGYPDAAFMRAARDTALAADPSMLLWYSFADIQKSDDPARHWNDLVGAAFAPPAPAASDPVTSPTTTTTATKKAKKKAKRRTRAKKSLVVTVRYSLGHRRGR